jgi:hypothetical protein
MNKILFGVIGLLLIGAFFFGGKELMRRSAGDNMRSNAAASASAGTSDVPLPVEPSVTPGSETANTPNTPIAQADSTATEVSDTYTMAQIKAHNTSSNCWSAISGSVYDLTAWIGKHPGGERAILKLCGADGTELFMDQHGGMEKQAAVLATFKIGTLAQ